MIIRLSPIILSLLLVACGTKHRDTTNVFRYNQSANISSLDPAFAKNQANIWAVNQLFNGLVQFDKDLNIHPCIAKNWQVSENGLTYTFTLRGDVQFHENECFEGKAKNVVAADVSYSLGRIIDPEVASPGAWIFNDKVREEDPFVAVDDTTFVLHLKQPFGPMMGILAMQYCSIVPKEAVEFYGDQFRSNPVGTGPFQFESWREMEALIYTRNDNYFESTGAEPIPYLDKVVISFIANKSTEFLAFLDDDIDFVSDIDGGLKDLVLDLNGGLKGKYQERIQLIRAPYLNTEYLGFMMEGDRLPEELQALENSRVRQAINYGFDRVAMIRYLRNNKGKPALHGMIPDGLRTWSEPQYGYPFRPDTAKELLAEAGYPNGEGLPAIPLYVSPQYLDLCELIQQQLAEVGIELKLEVTQPALLRSRMEKGEAAFFRGSWIADYPDPESYMALFYSGYGAPPNYTRFINPVVDSLYEVAMVATDPAVRTNLYRRMDSIVTELAPVVPLYYDEVYRFAQPNVTGLDANAMNVLNLKYVRKDG